jgi:hypothetical protein
VGGGSAVRGPKAPKTCVQTTGPSKIIGSATTSTPTEALGALIGGAIGGPSGAALGATIGSLFGVGGNVSIVPSTGSVYVGPTAAVSIVPGGGDGVSANYVNVPSNQSANSNRKWTQLLLDVPAESITRCDRYEISGKRPSSCWTLHRYPCSRGRKHVAELLPP